MPNEFDITDAKIVRDRLNDEILSAIAETESSNSKKQGLLELLDIIISKPNLIKENETLNKAIDKNRGMLEGLEYKFISETKHTNERIAVLQNQVLNEETRFTEIQNSNNAEIKEMAKEHSKTKTEMRNQLAEEMEDINNSVEKAKDRREEIITETAEMEAKLKLFKEKVANM